VQHQQELGAGHGEFTPLGELRLVGPPALPGAGEDLFGMAA
jgi:hypothetical protein